MRLTTLIAELIACASGHLQNNLVRELSRVELPTRFSNWSAKLSAASAEFFIEKSSVVGKPPSAKSAGRSHDSVVVPSGNSGKFFLSTSNSSLIPIFHSTPSGMTVAGTSANRALKGWGD
jgi:hypothetical protein